jgi:GNAT superfamily N-acetyltransferase
VVTEVLLRPFSAADEDDYVALRMPWELLWDEASIRSVVRGERMELARFTMAEVRGRLVGASLVIAPEPDTPEAFRTALLVAPEHRGGGIGRLLLDDTRANLPATAILTGVARDDDDAALAALKSWGFRQTTHGIAASWTVEPVKPPTPPPGIAVQVVRSWDELPAGFGELLCDSDSSPERASEGPMSVQRLGEVFTDPVIVLATVDGALAAAVVAGEKGPGRWFVGYTGVRPTYRRRGLARLVKQYLHATAHREGVAMLDTMNEASNTAVRALNAQLGYVPGTGQIRVRQSSAEQL